MISEPEFIDNSSNDHSFLDQPPPGLEEHNGIFWGQMLDWEHRTSAVSSGDGQEISLTNEDYRLSSLLQAFKDMRSAPIQNTDQPPKWHLPYLNKPLTLFELILDADEIGSVSHRCSIIVSLLSTDLKRPTNTLRMPTTMAGDRDTRRCTSSGLYRPRSRR